MITYVTYTDSGELDGYYIQDLQPAHVGHYIEVSPPLLPHWTAYRATADRSGLELIPVDPPVPDPVESDPP